MVVLNLRSISHKFLCWIISLRISLWHQMVYNLAISTNWATGNLPIAIWWHLPTHFCLLLGLVVLCESFNLLLRSLLILQIDVSVLWTLGWQDCRSLDFLAQEILLACTDHGIAHIVFWINNRRDFIDLLLHRLSVSFAEIIKLARFLGAIASPSHHTVSWSIGRKTVIIIIWTFLNHKISWSLLFQSMSSLEFQFNILFAIELSDELILLLLFVVLESGLNFRVFSEWCHWGNTTHFAIFGAHRVRTEALLSSSDFLLF